MKKVHEKVYDNTDDIWKFLAWSSLEKSRFVHQYSGYISVHLEIFKKQLYFQNSYKINNLQLQVINFLDSNSLCFLKTIILYHLLTITLHSNSSTSLLQVWHSILLSLSALCSYSSSLWNI